MPQELQLQVLPEVAATADLLTQYVANHVKCSIQDIKHITILKRSIDARQRSVKINLKVDVFYADEDVVHRKIDFPEYKNVK
ncbi:MAG: FAD-binding protein, partial [Flavobacterium sp.]